MASEGITKMLSSDLLEEFNLKPWWEKFRGYCLAAGFATALSIIFLQQTAVTLTCLPIGHNATDLKDFPTPQANFVNNYCASQFPEYILYIGLIALSGSVHLLFVASYWLHAPSVANSFRTYVKAEEIFESLKAADKNVKAVRSGKDSPDELQSIRTLFWEYTTRWTTEGCYQLRNIILVLTALATAGGMVAVCVLLKTGENVFDCATQSLENKSNAVAKGYFCYHNSDIIIFPYAGIFVVCVLAQIPCTLIGLEKIRKTCDAAKDAKLKSRGLKTKKFIKFMNVFLENSRPSGSGIFPRYCDNTIDEALEEIPEKLNSGTVQEDISSLEYYSNLRKFDGTLVFFLKVKMIRIQQLERQLTCGFSIDHVGKDSRIILLRIINSIEVTKWNDHMFNLLKQLQEMTEWELLAAALNLQRKVPKTNDTEAENEFFKNFFDIVQINFDEIGRPFKLGQSILHHISTNRHQTAAKRLLGNAKDGRTKYVHTSDKTIRARDILSKELSELIELSEAVPNNENTKPSLSQVALKEILAQGTNIPREEYDRIYELRPCNIFRHKFTHWDENANGLARFLYERKDWQNFTDLLNAYIVSDENSDELKMLDCEVQDFDVTCLIPAYEFGRTCATTAFTKPDYYPRFIPTAAKHILACIFQNNAESEIRNARDVVIAQIEEFCRIGNPQINLEKNEKDFLIRLIQKCRKPEEEDDSDVLGPSSSQAVQPQPDEQNDPDVPGPSNSQPVQTQPDEQIASNVPGPSNSQLVQPQPDKQNDPGSSKAEPTQQQEEQAHEKSSSLASPLESGSTHQKLQKEHPEASKSKGQSHAQKTGEMIPMVPTSKPSDNQEDSFIKIDETERLLRPDSIDV